MVRQLVNATLRRGLRDRNRRKSEDGSDRGGTNHKQIPGRRHLSLLASVEGHIMNQPYEKIGR